MRAPCLWISIGVASLAGASCLTGGPAPADARAVAMATTFPGAGPPERLASDVPFQSLEGPLWVARDGGFLLFSDVVEKNAAGARIYRFDPPTGRFSPFPYPGAPATLTSTNGLATDASGRLVACERYNGRLVRVEPDGALTTLAARWPAAGGAPLNAPNDVVARADGNIYFSDTDWGAAPGAHAPTAVYRVAPDGALSRVIAMEKPNGVALAPDGGTLYIGSDTQNKLWRAPVAADGAVGAPSLFVDGASVTGGFKVPDGICVDDDGNLYVANNDDAIKAVVVFDAAGRTRGRIALPDKPSNCTFGGPDRRVLFVTTLHAIYRVAVPIAGLP